MARTHPSDNEPVRLGVMRRFFEAHNKRVREAGMRDLEVRVDAHGNLDSAPGKPGKIQVTQTENGLTLLWKPAMDDNGVRAYRIYRDGKPYATVRGSTWFTDTKATGPHDYEVRALDSSNLEGVAATLPLRQASQAQGEQGEQQAQAGAAGAPTPAGAASQAAAGAGQLPAPQYSSLTKPDAQSFALGWQPIQGAVAYGVYQNGKLIGHVKDPTFAAKVAPGEPVIVEIDAVTADGTRSARGPALAVRLGAQGAEFAPARRKDQAAAPAGQAPTASAGQAPTASAGQAPTASAGQAPTTSAGQAPTTSQAPAAGAQAGATADGQAAQAPTAQAPQAPRPPAGGMGG